MAAGDDAAEAGMDVVPQTGFVHDGATEINKTRDYLAQRTSTVQPVAKGGTGATNAAVARANLGVPAAGTIGGNAVMDIAGSGDVGLRWGGTRFVGRKGGSEYEIALFSDAIAASNAASAASNAAATAQGTANGARAGYLTSDVYNRTLGGSYRVLYVNADGTIGWVSSARRHKKSIRPAVVDPAAVLALDLVTFLYKVEIDTGREGITQWGFVADQAADLGLDWLVERNTDGEIEGFRYDRFALALLPVVQHLSAQLADDRDAREQLAARVAAIELHLDTMGGDLDA